MSLEERVRSTLHEAGSRINVADIAIHPLDTAGHSPRRRLSPALAFVTGVVAVLLAAAVFWLGRGNESPPAEDPPSPLETVDPGSFDWRPLDLLPADFSVNAIAEGPAGWITVASRFRGSVGAQGELVFFVSEDGVNWSELESTGLPSAVHLDGFIGHDEGYLAYGLYAGNGYTVTTRDRPSNFAEPAVWASVDGLDWVLTPLPLPDPSEAISDVVSYRIGPVSVDGLGAVAIGIEFDEDLPDIEGEQVVPTRQITWVTDESGEWILTDVDELDQARSLAKGPAGTIAVVPSEGGFVLRNRDRDGAWVDVGVVPSQDQAVSLSGGPLGYVVGTRETTWVSTDGVDWKEAEVPAPTVTLGVGSHGVAVVTRDAEGAGSVWWSDDLEEFLAIGSEDDLDVSIDYLSGVTVTSHAVIIFGQSGSGLTVPDDVEGFLLVGTG